MRCPTYPWGPGCRRKRERAQDPSPVSKKSPNEPEKSPEPISFAVTDFLAGLRLTGSERVLGALALALAEGLDASPVYAKGKLAHELREILVELSKAELAPGNLDLLQGIDL